MTPGASSASQPEAGKLRWLGLRRASLRMRLMLLVVAGLVPAALLILYFVQMERQRAVQEAHADALRMVQLIASQQERHISDAQDLLRVLAMIPPVRTGSTSECNTFLADLLKHFPIYANLGRVGAQGEVICSAVAFSPLTSAADRSWFQEPRQTRRLAVGGYQIGRITGQSVLVAAAPLLTADGHFSGVLFAALDLAWFDRLMEDLQLPAGAAITVVDRSGTILARKPRGGNLVGRSQPDAPLIRALLQQLGTGTAMSEGLDGVLRIYAFAPLRANGIDLGGYVAAGIPAEVAFEQTRQMLQRNLAVLATVGLFALLAAWLGGEFFILRQVRALRATAGRLAAGELAARTAMPPGAPELVELATTVDTMASALEARIDERERAEALLRRREEDSRLLFASSPHPMWVYCRETLRFLEVNTAAIEHYGYSREEFLGMRLPDIRPEEDTPALMDSLTRERRALEHSGVWRHRLNDGRVIHAEVTSHTLDFQGRPAVLVVAIDVTERVRAERALHLSEERFAKAFHASPDAITISTLEEGRYIEVNEGFERLIGYSRHEAAGRTAAELKLWPSSQQRNEVVALLRQQGRIRERAQTFLNRSGAMRHTLLSAELVELLGEPCMLAVVRDVTDQQILEQQLRQAQKMDAIGRLAGGVAHDFNNLLMVILGHADLLLERLETSNPLRRHGDEIRKAARRAAALTAQLLTFSRKQVVEPQLVRLDGLLSHLAEMLRRLIGEDIELKTHLTPGLWPVRADPGQLEQVLMNLAINARDAMPQGGQLTIEASNVFLDESYARRHHDVRPGEYVLLTVSDTGVGMDEETQARIFEPFFTTKEPGKGTGLGLAIVYGIVKQSGGFPWVYSEPGKGTTFKIYLPSAEELTPRLTVSAAEVSTAKELSKGSETILVVEDAEPVRLLARECLADAGYTVVEAADGAEAIRVAESFAGPIHLLFTDLVMPGMGGIELAGELRKLRPRMQVLFASGYTRNGAQHTLLKPGLNFLAKPFSPAELLRRVRAILDARSEG